MVQQNQFCMGGCEEKRQLKGSRRSKMICGFEAEESPLLEAVAREGLVKTQQAGKGLSGCSDDL
jgi:hypothetical protein